MYQVFEIYNILPGGYFRGRKGYLVDRVIYTLIKNIANIGGALIYISSRPRYLRGLRLYLIPVAPI